MKSVFPVLVGEVAMSQLTSAIGAEGEGSSCECGGKRKKECCKEKASERVHAHVRYMYDSYTCACTCTVHVHVSLSS